MQENKRTPIDRLNYSGSLDPVVQRLSTAYGIGPAQDFSVIGIGYEDCNVIVEAERGKYVAKIFSKVRTPQDIVRYSTIIGKAVEAGVNHPPLLKTENGDVVYTDRLSGDLSLVLMRFIEGKTFLQLNHPPNDEERKAVIEQAAKINKIDLDVSYVPDSWAIPNIQAMFDRTKQFIKPEDLVLVEQAIARYNAIPVSTLPHCFVHGDFTKANVLKADNSDIYIFDFSVANRYPRIQELAVIAANLLHDDENPTSLRDRTEIVAQEYSVHESLEADERRLLYDYALAGVAMELMGGYQEKYLHGNDTEETEYWLKLGREGLRRELS